MCYVIQTIVGDEVASVMVTLKFAWDGKEIQIHYLCEQTNLCSSVVLLGLLTVCLDFY